MHKLVILIEPPVDPPAFQEGWPQFLHYVEAMPGLRREATSRVEDLLFGDFPWEQIHELFFDSLQDARLALASPPGQEAGRLLQMMTQGRMTLFFAEHLEDDIENIRKHRPSEPDESD